jgi:hypothetical protein
MESSSGDVSKNEPLVSSDCKSTQTDHVIPEEPSRSQLNAAETVSSEEPAPRLSLIQQAKKSILKKANRSDSSLQNRS